MARKQIVTIALAGSILMFAGIGGGCKKQEETAPAPAKQPAAPVILSTLPIADFENGITGWSPSAKAVKLSQATDNKHGGNASLKISGNGETGRWSYAYSPKFKLESGAKYKLTGWMKVESISDPKKPPFLKCAVNQGSKWLSNSNTKKYDLKKLNDWQELTVEFTSPPENDLVGFLAVEKGTDAVAIETTLYLDDIKFEKIQ